MVSDGTADDDSSVPPFVGSSLEEESLYSLIEGLDEKATDGDIVGDGVGVTLSEGGTERGIEDGCDVVELGACDDDSCSEVGLGAGLSVRSLSNDE